MLILFLCVAARAQVNSGSNGSDGALDFSSINYATNIVIDMHDHPNGIYQYTYVNIGAVTITFIPNANNTPVTWLVQSNVLISGRVDISGQPLSGGQGGAGGPGGWAGGNGGSGGSNPVANSGLGPGGGAAGYMINSSNSMCPGQASFGTNGDQAGFQGL